jgi:hypothetical protein
VQIKSIGAQFVCPMCADFDTPGAVRGVCPSMEDERISLGTREQKRATVLNQVLVGGMGWKAPPPWPMGIGAGHPGRSSPLAAVL